MRLTKPLYQEPLTGKEHSLKYDEIDSCFAKYLRLNFYNVKLNNVDIHELKKSYGQE